MGKRIYILVLSLTAFISAAAQTPAGFDTVCGKVVDSKTGEPVFFASVSLEGSRISNVTNSEGVFTLKVPEGSAGQVLITHLGYANASIPIASFAGSSSDSPKTISLIPSSIRLEAAVVRSIDPDQLFNTVLRRIKDNYPDQHVWMTAFYREMIRKGTGKYLTLNEAIVDIDKAPYDAFTNDRSKIYKGRGSQNYTVTDTLFVNFQGGIVNSLMLDIAKNPFVGCSQFEAANVYDFELGQTESIDDKPFLVLKFNQKPGIEDILYNGRAYIDPESFAIARLEFSVNLAGREEEASGIFVLKKPAETTFYIENAEYVVNYKRYGDKWYFEYCRTLFDFSTRKRKSIFRTHYGITSEMAVTNHHEEEIRILSQDRVKLSDILSERVSDFTDDNFWEGYNVIEPDKSIDNIVRIIVRQLKNREK